jgi:hypothetical protein
MKVLALDISTKTGWALFENGVLTKHGLIKNPKKIHEYGKYPWCYLVACEYMGQRLLELFHEHSPTTIVIEETNGSRARYTQKVLEFLHCCLLARLADVCVDVKYVNSSEWRKTLGLALSKDDKKANKKLRAAKQLAEKTKQKLNRVELGIRGIVNKKHVAIRYVNETYKLEMKVKDNDICDAICLGAAYTKGCSVCDGK